MYAFGDISEYLNLMKIPQQIGELTQQVVKMAAGEKHALFLMGTGQVLSCG